MNDSGNLYSNHVPFSDPANTFHDGSDSKPKGVFVLGMHRSGTSAVTGVIHRLGLPIGEPKDQMSADDGNSKGYFELIPLMQENNLVLQTLGVNWTCPPKYTSEWHLDPKFDALKPRSREVFLEVLCSSQWVWKDPRTCVTFKYWSDLLDCHQVVVIVVRNPLEVADSMAVAHGSTRRHALALWERYMRSALEASRGKPAIVCSYESLVESPIEWIERMRSFLLACGLTLDEEDPARAAADSVDSGLHRRRSTRSPGKSSEATNELCELYEYLMTNQGLHFPWDSPPPGDESATTEVILDEHANLANGYMTRFDAQRLIMVHDRLKEAFRAKTLEWEREREALLRKIPSVGGGFVKVFY